MKRCLFSLTSTLAGLFFLNPLCLFGTCADNGLPAASQSCLPAADSTSRAWLLRRNFSALAERIPAYGNEIDVSVTNFSVAERTEHRHKL